MSVNLSLWLSVQPYQPFWPAFSQDLQLDPLVLPRHTCALPRRGNGECRAIHTTCKENFCLSREGFRINLRYSPEGGLLVFAL